MIELHEIARKMEAASAESDEPEELVAYFEAKLREAVIGAYEDACGLAATSVPNHYVAQIASKAIADRIAALREDKP